MDPAALEAAILNIALNARDAMPDGGTVSIASEPGRGTTVIIYLPLTRREPRSTAQPSAPIMPPVVSRTILVVEDEAAVRTTVRRQLETLGHKVKVADSADTAVPEAQERIKALGAPLLSKPSTLSQLDRALNEVAKDLGPEGLNSGAATAHWRERTHRSHRAHRA